MRSDEMMDDQFEVVGTLLLVYWLSKWLECVMIRHIEKEGVLPTETR